MSPKSMPQPKSSSKSRIFVAMPFRPQFAPVLDLIKEAAASLGMQVVQAGEEAFTGSIISFVRSSIEDADLVVAIVTDENGNVYYEIGLAHCQQKPVVLLTTNPETLKFDLRDHRAIIYDADQPHQSIEELKRVLKAALEVSADPEQFISEKFGGAGHDPKRALKRGIAKIVETISQEAGLQEPVSLKEYRFLEESRELAVTVVDFLGAEARAIVDVNGMIRVLRKI